MTNEFGREGTDWIESDRRTTHHFVFDTLTFHRDYYKHAATHISRPRYSIRVSKVVYCQEGVTGMELARR